MQKTMLSNQCPDASTSNFRNLIENPLKKCFADWIIMGTICGAMDGMFALVETGSLPTTICAIVSYAAVGAISGWLIFGLFDIIANGRLEPDAELLSDETRISACESCLKVEPRQALQTTLSKAS